MDFKEGLAMIKWTRSCWVDGLSSFAPEHRKTREKRTYWIPAAMLPSVALSLNSCSGFPAAPSHHQAEKVSGSLLLGSIKFPSNSSCSFNGLSANPLILSTTRKVTSLAVASNQLDPAVKVEGGKKMYYFLVANAKFMLDEEEHFQEQMVERLRLFKERNMEQDFWLAIEPKFLDKFPQITKRLGRPAVALVSTNGPWIT
ncbi:hypothetical protein C5167_045424 [Papaver somniferum]|uniref:Ycf54-like protein n=1 Tax=Papaver somniferum TaxID=3469 RepID=A0A4Y7LDD9_PAPSO|nr:hypothetical protein C5167_045424 [Papaver somniferum]